MGILKGKHNIAEIQGVRCTVVETGASSARVAFLTELLTFNKQEVKSEQEKSKDGATLDTFVIGVTDILFNPMLALYQKKFVRKDGKTITPNYWNEIAMQDDLPYWQVER